MAPIGPKRKSVKFLELDTRGKNNRSGDQKRVQFLDNTFSDTKSALILVFDSSNFLSRQLIWNHIKQVFCFDHIAYSSELILKPKNGNEN